MAQVARTGHRRFSAYCSDEALKKIKLHQSAWCSESAPSTGPIILTTTYQLQYMYSLLYCINVGDHFIKYKIKYFINYLFHNIPSIGVKFGQHGSQVELRRLSLKGRSFSDTRRTSRFDGVRDISLLGGQTRCRALAARLVPTAPETDRRASADRTTVSQRARTHSTHLAVWRFPSEVRSSRRRRSAD